MTVMKAVGPCSNFFFISSEPMLFPVQKGIM